VKLKLDERWTQATEKDPLIHMSGKALSTMRAMNRRAFRELKQEEYVLYGFPGIASAPYHWINRRRAAARVCELALKGNFEAVDLMCSRMTKDTSWIVRQIALTEACRILVGISEATHGQLARDAQHLIITAICDSIFQGPIRPESELSREARLQQDRTDQEATVEALCSELPRYGADVLAELIGLLTSCARSASGYEHQWKPSYERVLHAARQM
jgi:hypothetical protein